MTLLPFGAKPYLCVSTLMDVTPGRRKSRYEEEAMGKPAEFRRGTRKEPKQQSTCKGNECVKASLESAASGSMMPCG